VNELVNLALEGQPDQGKFRWLFQQISTLIATTRWSFVISSCRFPYKACGASDLSPAFSFLLRIRGEKSVIPCAILQCSPNHAETFTSSDWAKPVPQLTIVLTYFDRSGLAAVLGTCP
jgi:hypothetical protein